MCIDASDATANFQERFFVILPETETHPSHARTTHAVDILAFVGAQDIPALYFETPYHLAPAPGGERAYALLREILRRTHKIGIAYVVIRSRQHLAALVPQGQSLVLNTLRWEGEATFESSFGLSIEEMLEADELAMMAIPGSDWPRDGGDLAWHRASYQRDFAPLEEPGVKANKSPEILIQELENLLDDDDPDNDGELVAALDRKPHTADGHAMRRGRKASRPVGRITRSRLRRS